MFLESITKIMIFPLSIRATAFFRILVQKETEVVKSNIITFSLGLIRIIKSFILSSGTFIISI